jgi:hypothetical protein
MQTIVYQYDTAMPAQKLPNCCKFDNPGIKSRYNNITHLINCLNIQ